MFFNKRQCKSIIFMVTRSGLVLTERFTHKLASAHLLTILSIHQRLRIFVIVFRKKFHFTSALQPLSPSAQPSRNIINYKDFCCLARNIFIRTIIFRPDGWLLQSLCRQFQRRSHGGSSGSGSSSTIWSGKSQIFSLLSEYFCSMNIFQQ